jgi:hypothetical protein
MNKLLVLIVIFIFTSCSPVEIPHENLEQRCKGGQLPLKRSNDTGRSPSSKFGGIFVNDPNLTLIDNSEAPVDFSKDPNLTPVENDVYSGQTGEYLEDTDLTPAQIARQQMKADTPSKRAIRLIEEETGCPDGLLGGFYEIGATKPFTGVTMRYSQSGFLKESISYKSGKRHGLRKYFSPKRKLTKKICYKNDSVVSMVYCDN